MCFYFVIIGFLIGGELKVKGGVLSSLTKKDEDGAPVFIQPVRMSIWDMIK